MRHILIDTNTYRLPLTSLAVAVAVFANAANANPIGVTERYTTQHLSFTDASGFSDAALATSTVLTLAGNQGDTLPLNYITPDGISNFQAVSNAADFSVSAPLLIAGAPNNREAFTITANNDNANGTVTISDNLAANAAPSGALNTLSTGVNNGYNILDESYSPLGNQAVSSTFVYKLVINGDYSGVGTTTGDHELLSINAAWTIDKNFLFNGVNTVFQAEITPYTTANQLGLELQLYGNSVSSVPVPGAAWLLASGLGLLAFHTRKKA